MEMLARAGNRRIVRGDILKRVFDEIDIIGSACKQLLVELIEADGIVLDKDNWHTLSEIEWSLLKTFGEDATLLLMKRIEAGIVLLQNEKMQ